MTKSSTSLLFSPKKPDQTSLIPFFVSSILSTAQFSARLLKTRNVGSVQFTRPPTEKHIRTTVLAGGTFSLKKDFHFRIRFRTHDQADVPGYFLTKLYVRPLLTPPSCHVTPYCVGKKKQPVRQLVLLDEMHKQPVRRSSAILSLPIDN